MTRTDTGHKLRETDACNQFDSEDGRARLFRKSEYFKEAIALFNVVKLDSRNSSVF